MNPWKHGAQKVPSKVSKEKSTLRHFVVDFQNTKNKNNLLNTAKKKNQITYSKKKLTSNFLKTAMYTKEKHRQPSSQCRENTCQPSVVYLVKLSNLRIT